MQFRTDLTAVTDSFHFVHIPSSAFLSLIPHSALSAVHGGLGGLDLVNKSFETSINKLLKQEQAVVNAVSLAQKKASK